MSHLIYIWTMRGPAPQKLPDDVAGKPFVDEGIRGSVIAQHRIKPEEEGLSLDELAKRYPAPIPNQQASAP